MFSPSAYKEFTRNHNAAAAPAPAPAPGPLGNDDLLIDDDGLCSVPGPSPLSNVFSQGKITPGEGLTPAQHRMNMKQQGGAGVAAANGSASGGSGLAVKGPTTLGLVGAGAVSSFGIGGAGG